MFNPDLFFFKPSFNTMTQVLLKPGLKSSVIPPNATRRKKDSKSYRIKVMSPNSHKNALNTAI